MALPATIAPRGLSLAQAAEYCGVSDATLRRHGPAPSKIGTRDIWDKNVLDRWLDGLASPPPGAETNPISDPEIELLKAIDARKRTSLHSAPAQRRRKAALVLAPGRASGPPARRSSGADDGGGAA
jgi:hypothetical protein